MSLKRFWGMAFLMRSALALCSVALCMPALYAHNVKVVAGFPASEPGYSLGVSACYAGVIGDYVVMAGGCNFPEAGRPKRYYAGIYAARIDTDVLQWRLVGFLPEAAAYGATIASGDSLVFIGGNNSARSLRTVYSLHLVDGATACSLRRLADLPCAVDNMAVAEVDGRVFVVGGNQDGKPSARVMRVELGGTKPSAGIDGREPTALGGDGFKYALCQADSALCIPDGPRVQPVAVGYHNRLYVWGGFHADGANSSVRTDGYALDMASGVWTKVDAPCTDGGDAATLSGGVAWTDGERIFATGGVDRRIFLDAISGRYECVDKDDYLKQPIGWYRFNGNLFVFDCTAEKWLPLSFNCSGLARAGAQVVATKLGTYYIGGELKPMVRTPQILLLE